jgi:hypothetical protein
MTSEPSNGRVHYKIAGQTHREAQARLAALGRHVPKSALWVFDAFTALLTSYSKVEDDIAVKQILEKVPLDPRDTYEGIQFLREHHIIDRPKTKGGRTRGGNGIPARTRILSDAEATMVARREEEAFLEALTAVSD